MSTAIVTINRIQTAMTEDRMRIQIHQPGGLLVAVDLTLESFAKILTGEMNVLGEVARLRAPQVT